jgi:serpin B
MDATYYGATLGDLAGAPDDVNAWVASETHGLITQILPQEPASYWQQVTALIANAIYFKAPWTTAFDPNLTATAEFTLGDGTGVATPMMHQTGTYAYAAGTLAGTSYQAVRLPYGAGRLSMLIVMPAAGTPIATFTANLTAGTLAGVTGQLKVTSGSVALPRFTASFGESLNAALGSLGMGVAFCPTGDFAALVEPNYPQICIYDVEHKTVVEVDESGTVAAGATTVGIGIEAVAYPEFSITLDRPFFYAIEDDTTGALLFAGILSNPEA